MVSKRLGIYGFISAAAIVSGVLSGCAGSSASVQGIGPQVTTTGGLTNASGTGPAGGTTSSGAPQQVQVTVNGSTVTGTLPAGETIPAGGTVCTVAPGTPIIVGLTLGSKFGGSKTTPTGGSKVADSPGNQGQVWVDGANTGLTVDSSGDLSGYLILTPGNHTITAYGPFTIMGTSSQLDVGQFNFGVTINTDGIGSIPSGLTMKLPADGGSWANGNFVTVTYPTPDFSAGKGILTIVIQDGETIQQTKPVVGGTATYKSFETYKVGAQIPQGGVVSVTYNYYTQ